MAKPDKNTISDEEWARLQESAAKANPHLTGFGADAVKARKRDAEQRGRARDN